MVSNCRNNFKNTMDYIHNYMSPLGEITVASDGESLIGLILKNILEVLFLYTVGMSWLMYLRILLGG